MPRFECERDDIPKKWHSVSLVPGEGDEWLLVLANGIIDPANNDLPMNGTHVEFRGSFDDANEAMEKHIQYLVELGYHKVVQNDT